MRKNLKEARAAAGLTQQVIEVKGQRVLTTRQIAKRRGEILP